MEKAVSVMRVILKSLKYGEEDFKVAIVPFPESRANFALIYHDDIFNGGLTDDFLDMMKQHLNPIEDIELNIKEKCLTTEEFLQLLTE